MWVYTSIKVFFCLWQSFTSSLLAYHHILNPTLPKLKNSLFYKLWAKYSPSSYVALVSSKKWVKDQSHLNPVLESKLIITNEHKFGSYPTYNISHKCDDCYSNLILVTNIGDSMKIYLRDDQKFESLEWQTLRIACFFGPFIVVLMMEPV